MRTLHARGHRVYLLTDERHRGDDWPHEAIEEMAIAPAPDDRPQDRQDLVDAVARLLSGREVDRVIALDDFDVEVAALLREEFRIPGMGETTARYFRDKLAMRVRAREAGIAVPVFSALWSRGHVERFVNDHTGPYVIKPRGGASAAGISRVADGAEALAVYDALGERAYRHLMEAFAPGRVYHVDALSQNGAVGFARASVYADPPLAIVHGGGLFQTHTLEVGSGEHDELCAANARVLAAFGLRDGASHTEFIRDAAGRLLLLETSSRVGGAYIADMLRCATEVDLWAEWAKLEAAGVEGGDYEMPRDAGRCGAIVLRATSDEVADVSGIDDEAIAEVIRRPWHVGFVLAAGTYPLIAAAQERVARWVASYGRG